MPENGPKPHAPRARSDSIAPVEYHLLLLVTLGLVAFGLIMVYSASSGLAVLYGGDPLDTLTKQAIWAALGIVAMVSLARMPYRRLRYLAPVLLVGVVALLILVLIPGIGAEINGARRWLLLGPLSFQPSEFSKGAVLLFTAAVLAGRRRPPRTIKQLVNPVGGVALAVCGLVVFEPDLGTAIAIAVMVCGVLLVAGTPLRLYVSVASLFAVAAGVMIAFEPYRLQRMTAFLDPWNDPQGSGWQIIQAQLAIGSGGWWGVGLGNGTQKSYTPEASTDMIASVIAEELGLIGTLGTVAAFVAFAVLGYRIALRCRDPFGKYIVAGTTCLVAGQAFVNLGAVFGLLPLTGVPLPLISSGGSSLVVMLSLVGITLNIADSEAGQAARSRGGSKKAKAVDAEPTKQSAKTRVAHPDRRRGHGGARRAGAGGGRRATG